MVALGRLASVLRNPNEWPAGFSWDYTKPSGCAEALCRRLTNQQAPIDITESARGKIFVFADRFHPSRPKFEDVTPDHVADLIDQHLKGKL